MTPEEQREYLNRHREQLERQALFATCASKEHLHLWIKRYLGIDLPDIIVCDDDETNVPSNSSPLDLVWEVYVKALDGQDEHFQRVLAFAARDAFKTLSASILEVLCLFHLRRDVAHMAAIEPQAQKAAGYVAKYLQRPYLKDFVTGNNKREITVTRYENGRGEIRTPKEFNSLDYLTQREYEPISHYMKIVIATLAGANSEHVSFMVLDELDLAPEAPVEEAKMIPAPGQYRGELPITFMTSTRKFAFGLVQKEINAAAVDKDNHLQIRHWNIIDVTQRCPPTRHLPDQPKIPIYYSERTLKAIQESEYNILTNEEKSRYFKAEGYEGCLRNCAIFAACRGRLATKQKATDPKAKPRSMLKPIAHVISQFKSVSPDRAKAQLMCWTPSAEGLIYPYFQYSKHMLDPVAMYEQITGEEIPRKNPDGSISQQFMEFASKFGKAELIKFMQERGMEFHAGMDFGYTHNWSVVTGAKDGHRLFIFDVISVPQLEATQKAEMFQAKLSRLNPTVYPDSEAPAEIATMKRYGVRCKKFKKDVLGGIEAVRSKLLPGLGREAEIFFLAGDEGCELLARRISEYHWIVDANQKPTDVPDEKDDDECDALRYLVQNLFGNRTRFAAAIAGVSPTVAYDPAFPMPYGAGNPENPTHQGLTVYQRETVQEPTVDNWLSQEISKRTTSSDSPDSSIDRSGRKGSLIFDF